MSWAMNYPFGGWKGIIHGDTGTILTSSQGLVHSWGRKLGGRLRPRLVLSWNGGKGKGACIPEVLRKRCWERDIISFHSSDRNKRLKWKKYIFLKISPIHYFFFFYCTTWWPSYTYMYTFFFSHITTLYCKEKNYYWGKKCLLFQGSVFPPKLVLHPQHRDTDTHTDTHTT